MKRIPRTKDIGLVNIVFHVHVILNVYKKKSFWFTETLCFSEWLLFSFSHDLDMMSMSILPVFSDKSIQSVLDRIKPINVLKVYENIYVDRKIMYKDFKGDTNSYIYIIVNKLNGKIYVGSSRTLKDRATNT